MRWIVVVLLIPLASGANGAHAEPEWRQAPPVVDLGSGHRVACVLQACEGAAQAVAGDDRA